MIPVDVASWRTKKIEIAHFPGALELAVSLENDDQVLEVIKSSRTLAGACSEAFQGLLEGYEDKVEGYILEITDTHFRLGGSAVVRACLTLPDGSQKVIEETLPRQDDTVAACLAKALMIVDSFRSTNPMT
jgi:hypothetical protein